MRWTKFCRKTARPVSLRHAEFLFALLTLLASSFAQQATIRSRSNLVLVPTLVKDEQGSVVYGLQAQDFIIEDNGVQQSVRLDEAPEGQPVSLVVAIQRGRRAFFEFPRVQGLKSMLEPLFATGAVRVAIVEFDSRATLTRRFTSDESLIDADLSNLQQGDSGAAILDAIAYSIDLLKNEPDNRQRVLLLISETRDHGSHMKIEDAVTAVGTVNATMYALAFSPGLSNILDTGRGNNKDEMNASPDLLAPLVMTMQAMRKNVSKTIAAMTGGEYELFATRKKFELRMNDFTNHLHSRYLLSFVPQDPRPGLHQLRVQVKDGKNVTVLARSSYWSEGTR
ncbi:MAG: VWA domain-containing protein [Candidatus Sulfotelmatobacter sp.]